jgi:hypothetical protein
MDALSVAASGPAAHAYLDVDRHDDRDACTVRRPA